jgi:DNA-binding GntR family transcriptional regulator
MSTFDNQQAAADGVIMPIERSTYKNHVIKYIYDGMRENRYRAGEKILESHLSRELGISRAPIREALQSLRQAGLVEHEPRRGWFVVGFAPDDMWDIYLIRASIEALAARRVANQMSPRLLAQMQSLISQMAAAAERGEPEALAAYDVQFHERIIQCGGSRQLQRVWRQLHPQDWTIMSVLKLTEVPLPEMAQRHQMVLDALNSGDPAWAEAVIRRHILELAQRFLDLPTDQEEILASDARERLCNSTD